MEIKVSYSIRDNVGDSINPLIFSKIFGFEAVHSSTYNCEISGIGSGLRRFVLPKKRKYTSKLGLKSIILSLIKRKPYIIWSSGFTYYPQGEEIFLRKSYVISSVRGELTKKRLENITGKKLNITTGDAGLLASELLDDKPIKKYSVGIIPHDSELEEPFFGILASKYKKSKIINVRDDVMKVLNEICECEVVLSSSLHGLIIADSFNIPNKRVILTDKLSGDGYKFDDYYSSFGIQSTYIDLNKNPNPNIETIKQTYEITCDMVELKKKEIKEAFYKNLSLIGKNKNHEE